MKTIKITVSDFIAIIIAVFGAFTSSFSHEMRYIISDIIQHWAHYLFWGSLLLLCWRITHIILRNRFDNKLEKRFEDIDNKFNEFDKYNKQLIRNNEIFQEKHLIGFRIFRDLMLCPSIFKSQESQEKYARMFIIMEITKEDIEKYMDTSIPELPSFIALFEKIYYEEKIKKLNKIIYNEPNRTKQ